MVAPSENRRLATGDRVIVLAPTTSEGAHDEAADHAPALVVLC
jgi:hypothetical protein